MFVSVELGKMKDLSWNIQRILTTMVFSTFGIITTAYRIGVVETSQLNHIQGGGEKKL